MSKHQATDQAVTNADVARGPLAGIKVLDLTLALAGPLCAQRLGDMGAEVIKVEGPDRPDFTRNAPMCGVRMGGETTAYLSLNRNKHSLALDLKNKQARSALLDVAKSVDVVLQNFRPGVAERLGVDYHAIKAVNPDVIYVSISGYGDEGPLVAWPGQDLLVQCFSGTTLNAGTADGLPHPAPIYVVDVAASHNACEAVLAGLVQRARTGLGLEAKVSLLKAVLEIQIQEVTTFLSTGRKGARSAAPYASTWMEPPYGIYALKDGHLAIAQADLAVLAEVLERPELAHLKAQRPADDDTAAIAAWRDAIHPVVAQALAGQEVNAAFEALYGAKVWCAPVLDYAQLHAHPQAKGLFTEIDHPTAGRLKTLSPAIGFSTQSDGPMRPAPALGEDSEAVLTRYGLASQEVAALKASGAMR